MNQQDSASGDGDDGARVCPQIPWSTLQGRLETGQRSPASVYRAFLAMPDGQKVPVDLYNSQNPQQEVLVMQQLEGVAGIPRAYGMTYPAPRTLVVEFCPGCSLKQWKERGHIRMYLVALLHVCAILSRVHGKGVSHGNLQDQSIILHLKESGEVRVSLVDFHLARRDASHEDMEADERQVFSLVVSILWDMEEHFDRSIFERRKPVLKFAGQKLSLVEISLLLSSVLHDHPVVALSVPLSCPIHAPKCSST